MRAVRIRAHGAPAVVDTVADPVAGPGEVIVRVAGAALNPLDIKIASGAMRRSFPTVAPYVVGTDVSGTVEAVGPGVDVHHLGRRVVARLDPTVGGAAAELAVVGVDRLVDAPTTVPLAVAAGVVTAAATAWEALVEVAAVRPGQKILIQGGAGGVGGFAVQFARRLGAHVVATASGDGLRIASVLGADEVVDHRRAGAAIGVAGVDVVLDTVGGGVEERSVATLEPGGLLVALPAPPDVERAAARGVRAVFVAHAGGAARLDTVVRCIDDDRMHVLLDRMLPLEDGPTGLATLAEGRARGKIVLVADRVAGLGTGPAATR